MRSLPAASRRARWLLPPLFFALALPATAAASPGTGDDSPSTSVAASSSAPVTTIADARGHGSRERTGAASRSRARSDRKLGTPARKHERPTYRHERPRLSQPRLGTRPQLPRRPYDGRFERQRLESRDRRYARPAYRHLRRYPRAPDPPSLQRFYRPWYSHWWVHPYYRHYHSTFLVLSLGFTVRPWQSDWLPPPRGGWSWVAGYHRRGHWYPGYWRPERVVIVRDGGRYVWVPGWWQGEVYLEGYFRLESRDDGDWIWVDGMYLDDGTYLRGHWRPAVAPAGNLTWEAGFFDGDTWVEGYWRPTMRKGYRWVSSYFDDDGVFHAGYWEPQSDRPGFVWVPGWFDGNTWIEGYWVEQETYTRENVEGWTPEEAPGANDDTPSPSDNEGNDEPPLAIPATGD